MNAFRRSMNAFSPNYVSQIDTSDITRARKLSESNTKSLNERRQSDDPEVRQLAMGTIHGLGKKASAGKQAIGQWPKGKKLNQPPINSQAKLQSDTPMKSAKLSRGRAI